MPHSLLGHIDEVTLHIVRCSDWKEVLAIAALNKANWQLISSQLNHYGLPLCMRQLQNLYEYKRKIRDMNFCLYSKIATNVTLNMGDSPLQARAKYLNSMLDSFSKITRLSLLIDLPPNKYHGIARGIASRKPKLTVNVKWDTCAAWKSAFQAIELKHNVLLTSSWRMVRS